MHNLVKWQQEKEDLIGGLTTTIVELCKFKTPQMKE